MIKSITREQAQGTIRKLWDRVNVHVRLAARSGGGVRAVAKNKVRISRLGPDYETLA